jgi:hypothetical protein
MLLLVRAAAATDTEMGALSSELDTNRLERMTHNARTLIDGGHLRVGLTAEHAGQILWTYTSPELYDLLVVRQAWPIERYATFVVDALTAALLPDTTGDSR